MVPTNPIRKHATSSLFNFKHVSFFGLIILFIVLSLSVTGCVSVNDPEASQVYNSDSIGILGSKSSIGQSFVSRRPKFNGITLWITPIPEQETAPANSIQNSFNLKLFQSPGDAFPLFTTSNLIPRSGNNTPINIQIPNQNNPADQRFFIELTTNSGKFQINGRNEDVYPHGQVYIGEQPINADIAFRLSYEYDLDALAQDLRHGLANSWLIFPLLIVLWLPGWLLLDFSGARSRFDFGEQTALSFGISLGLIPIIMLWTTLVNINWTGHSVLSVAILLVVLLIFRLIYLYIERKKSTHYYHNPSEEQQPAPLYRRCFQFVIPLILIVIFLTTLTIRMIMVRDLATPAWVDSVHHALITQQILSLGSYPSNYTPFIDINPAAYHPGFHSIAATFTWLSKLSIDQSLLIFGQVLNALAIFSVYLFTKVLTHSSLAGIFAAIITGFLTPMPAYYTSWGRYTELTGLLILPAAFTLVLLLTEVNLIKRKYLIIFISAIILGGLFLVHYRVTVFLGSLFVSYFAIYILIKKRMPSIKASWGWVIMAIASAILLVFPWMVQTITSTVFPIIKSTGISTPPLFQGFGWPFLTTSLGKQTLVLAGLGLFWGMIKRERFSYLLLSWMVLLFLIANLDALSIPGGGLINNLSVEIMLFIPISILGGYLIDQIITQWRDLLPRKLIIPAVGTILVLTLMVVYTGSKQLITIVNPITILSRNADLPAIDWVHDNIPENETIVINPFLWGYGLYAGSDGGYWIAPLAGRATLPPPILYGLGSYKEQINQKSQKVIELGSTPIALWEYLTTNQLHYIFIGTRGGVISPEKLSSSDLFTVVYKQDGVWIFRIKP